jgi:hypothetical protein
MIYRTLIAAAAMSLAVATGASAAEGQSGLWNATAPRDGQNSGVVSPNSMPLGFEDGTAQGARTQTLSRWFASQGEPAYALIHATQPNG